MKLFIVQDVKSTEEELYRPHIHFTPKSGWMNDPNGMFYLNGIYHLCFQYYPGGNTWGPMHWGHAVSSDLIRWEEKPIAIYPDDKGYIFSGSAVVDVKNTSGLGENGVPPIVAVFTYHDMEGEKANRTDYETQAIAYSLDEGKTFKKYDGNPVIGNEGIKDIRDPKVIWDKARNQWVMVLAAGQEILFYSSSNLKDWKLESNFGEGEGAHGGVWECPDLIQMKVESTGELKWVLFVSINPGGPNEGSATQYFVGDFDGVTFSLDQSFKQEINNTPSKGIWIDYGRDNYAGVTWSNIPDTDGRQLFIGWMSNWDYGQKVPTESWRSAMTIARSLSLHSTGESYKLFSHPVTELDVYRERGIKKESVLVSKELKLIGSENIGLSSTDVIFEFEDASSKGFEFSLRNKRGDVLSFGYDQECCEYYLNRSKAGLVDFSDKFSHRITTAKRTSTSHYLSGRIILDKTSIELFFDGGETVITEIFFPVAPFEELVIVPQAEALTLKRIEMFSLKTN